MSAAAVTVIVPVYNECRTIDTVLTRLLANTEFEVVIVDDGSIDGTARLLDPWRQVPGWKVLTHDVDDADDRSRSL
jgi:cellulose synthase/poly-beta-1,6-N-acetylglucosamine synthase-like glycosyltransferase